MVARNLLSHSELRSLLLRSAGVVASAATGLISLKVFLTFGQKDAASLVAIVGWMVFLPLAQLGFGRPAYGEVRSRYATATLAPALVSSFLKLFARQAVLATTIFSIVGVAVAARQGFTGSLAEVAIFALGLAALNASSFHRDLAYGVSHESQYEFWEFVRRCAILAGYGFLVAGAPLWLFGFGCLIVGAWSQWLVGRSIIGGDESTEAQQPHHWRDLQPKLGSDAKRYLLFSANETLLYNLPLVVFTATSANTEVIYFGIWLRLFQLLVLPMRMIVDARLNRQTTAYFQRDPNKVRGEMKVSLLAAGAITVCALAAVFICKRTILGWIGAAALDSDVWLMASLGVWGAANTVQHVFGSFTLSYGGGFSFALRVSLATLVAMCLTFALGHALEVGVGPIMFCLGVIYAMSSILYGRHVRQIVRTLQQAGSSI